MVFTLTDFDKAEAKGKKNCSKGLACGAGCISKTKKCKQKIGAGGGAYADHIGDPANLEKGAESSEVSGEAQKTNVQIRESDLADERSALIEKYGDELVSKAESNTQKIIDDNDVMVRIPAEHIDAIIKDGKMLNSAEVAERRIADGLPVSRSYQQERNEYENTSMGLPLNTSPSDRPIYGYIGNSSDINAPHQKSVESYGDVAIKLNSSAKDRASVTTDDSFAGGKASKANNFNAGSFVDDDTKADKYLGAASQSKTIDDYVQKTGSPYLEAQIQGGVKTSDIAEMHFNNGSKPTANTEKWAKQNGVKIFTYD